jgi:hypothetical protein
MNENLGAKVVSNGSAFYAKLLENEISVRLRKGAHMLDMKHSNAQPGNGPIVVSPLRGKQLEVLFVEPDVIERADRPMALLERDYRVSLAKDIREIFFLRERPSFAVVVLSALLGPFALVEAARSVRRQWPGARIVIIGQAANVLEDHLYDETVAQSCKPQELIDMLAQLTSDPWTIRTVGRPFVVPTPAVGLKPLCHPQASSRKC